MGRAGMVKRRQATDGGVAAKDAGRGAPAMSNQATPQAQTQLPVWRRTWFLALSGAVLLWIAFPPLNLWPLAYVAVVPWLLLVREPKLAGRRPYLVIYAAAFLHWLMLLQGIRMAHWALYFGWFALSAYVACYTPVMIAVARVMVHRLRVPLLVAAPVAWVGIELIRGYVISGFSMGLLGHTQVAWTSLLQVADFGGAYAVSFVVVTVAAGIAGLVPLPAAAATSEGRPTTEPLAWGRRAAPLGVAIALLLAAVGYGAYRLRETRPGESAEPVRVALIQGSLDTVFDVTPERVQETFSQYGELTRQVRAAEVDLDLVVWPESMFPILERLVEEPLQSPPGTDIPPEHLRGMLVEANRGFENAVLELSTVVQPPAAKEGSTSADPADTYAVIGVSTLQYGPYVPKMYNGAVLIEPGGKIISRYNKMHAVMCGEYMPLGDLLPWIYGVTPMAAGLTVGEEPSVFQVRGQRFSPSICFESTVPHLLHGQVNELAARGSEPDALLNVTNDGWFKGSAILDLHFRCSIFRAIENRKPMVIAANTGFSAWIDGNGKVLKQGPRRAPTTLVAEVRPDGRISPYRRIGDLLAWCCAAACWVSAIVGVWTRNPASTR